MLVRACFNCSLNVVKNKKGQIYAATEVNVPAQRRRIRVKCPMEMCVKH